MRLPTPPVMLVTDRKQAVHPLDHVVSEVCRAGCRWVSVREKDLCFDELQVLFATLRDITQQWGGTLGIHGSAEDALRLQADSLHLPAQADAAHARSVVGAGMLIGQSVHGAHEAEMIDNRLLDYALAAPVFLTKSKPGYGPALGQEGLMGITAKSRVPVLALGGVTAQNAPLLGRTGITGVAVMGELMRSPDPYTDFQHVMGGLNAPYIGVR